MKLLTILALLCLALPASANAGTPLMWWSCCYLTIANLLIGVVEAALLAWLARVPCRMATMIGANYVSAFAGAGLIVMLSLILDHIAWNPFRWGLTLIVAMWVVAFALTVVVESPFVAAITRQRPFSKRTLRHSAIINATSYTVLLSITALAGPVTLFTNARYAEPETIGAPSGWVYYLRELEIRRIRLDGARDEFVAMSPAPGGCVGIVPNGKDAKLLWTDFNAKKPIDVLSFPGAADRTAPSEKYRQAPFYDFASLGYFTSRDMRTDSSRLSVSVGFWAAEGVRVGAPQNYTLAAETPFLSLAWRYATVLPGNLLVARCGPSVVLVDLNGRRLGMLCRGDSPSVLLDRPVSRHGVSPSP